MNATTNVMGVVPISCDQDRFINANYVKKPAIHTNQFSCYSASSLLCTALLLRPQCLLQQAVVSFHSKCRFKISTLKIISIKLPYTHYITVTYTACIYTNCCTNIMTLHNQQHWDQY